MYVSYMLRHMRKYRVAVWKFRSVYVVGPSQGTYPPSQHRCSMTDAITLPAYNMHTRPNQLRNSYIYSDLTSMDHVDCDGGVVSLNLKQLIATYRKTHVANVTETSH